MYMHEQLRTSKMCHSSWAQIMCFQRKKRILHARGALSFLGQEQETRFNYNGSLVQSFAPAASLQMGSHMLLPFP
jgi:hypothetical protein